MKFSCNREYLLKVLSHVKGFDAPSRVIGPSGVVIEVLQSGAVMFRLGTVTPSSLCIAVSDLEKIKGLEVGITMPPLGLLLEVVNTLTGEMVEISAPGTDPDKVAKVLEIHCERNIVKLHCLSEEKRLDTRKFDEPKSWWGINADVLASGTGDVLFAVSTDDRLSVLRGVRVKGDGEGLAFSAANQFLMAHRKTEVLSAGEADVEVICYPAYLAWVARFAKSFDVEAVKLAFTDKSVHASIVNDGMSCMALAGTIQGTFPPLDKFLMENKVTVVDLDLGDLKGAMRTVRAFSKREGQAMKLVFNDGINVTTADKDGEGASAYVDAEIVGAAQEMALNVTYLDKAVSVIGPGKARLSLNQKTDPIVIKPVNRDMLYVQMPIFKSGT